MIRPTVAALAALLLPAALALATPAHAQRVSADGAKLLKVCDAKTQGSSCEAYVSGVADTAEAYQDVSGQRGNTVPRIICVPADVPGRGLREAMVVWLQAHPDDQKVPAAVAALRMLHANYACKP